MTTAPNSQDGGRIPPIPETPDLAVATELAGRAGEAAEPQIPAAGGTRARIGATSPVLQGLLALTVYQVVWLVVAGALPLVTHPARAQLGQSGTDPNFYVWALRWWPYAIAHGLNPLHTALVEVPFGANLAWATTSPPLALIVAPITVIFGPVVSFNLLAAISLPVSAWAAFVLCRRITGRFWPALAGGAVFGFSSFEATHIVSGQLNLSFSLLLPLMAYLIVLWWDKAISARVLVALLALLMMAQFYLFLETFTEMTAVLAAGLLAGYALADRSRRPTVVSLAKLTALAYLLAIAAASPYLLFALSHVPPHFGRKPGRAALDLLGLVMFSHGNLLGLSWLTQPGPHPTWRAGGYVGIPLLAVAAATAVLTWSRKITRFLTIMLFVVVVAALGPTVRANGKTLFGLFWKIVWHAPFIRSALPVRLMLFAFLALAVIMALWLAGPSKRPWARWMLALPAIAGVIASVPALSISTGPGMPPFITTGEYRHFIAPDATVIVVSRTNNAGLLWQAQTDFYTRLAGGLLNKGIAKGTVVPKPVVHLVKEGPTPAKIQAFWSFVRAAHVSAILVQEGSWGKWQVVLTGLGLPHQTVGGVTIYRTGLAG